MPKEAQEDIKVDTGADIPEATPILMDIEMQNAIEHRQRIANVTLEIEQILIREDFSMGDLASMLDYFNSRAHNVFSLTKIKDLKAHYDRTN